MAEVCHFGRIFHEALLITRLNEREKDDHRRDAARIFSKPSEALLANRQWSESNKAKQEADKIYEELIFSGKCTETNNGEKWEYLESREFRYWLIAKGWWKSRTKCRSKRFALLVK